MVVAKLVLFLEVETGVHLISEFQNEFCPQQREVWVTEFQSRLECFGFKTTKADSVYSCFVSKQASDIGNICLPDL